MVGWLFDGVVATSAFLSAIGVVALLGIDADESRSSIRVAIAIIDLQSVLRTE